MCGRYAASRNPDDLVEEFDLSFIDVAQPLAPDWNVAPTKDVYAVVVRPPRHSAAAPDPVAPGDEAPQARRLRVVRWGLVPSWAPDDRGGARLVNARVETVAEKPAFRAAFRQRRCLLPADGYYEWMPVPDGPRPGKQACFIRPRDGGVLAMAGLYELWRDPTRRPDEPGGGWLWTCAVLTTAAEDELGHVHDRMPLMLERDRYAAWLDPTVDDVRALADLLTPAAPGRLEVVPVSARVGDVRTNGPELVERVEPASTAAPTLF